MDKETFLAADSDTMWLLRPDLSERLEMVRRQIGLSFQWSDPQWYTDKVKLEKFYNFIELKGTQVLLEFDQATDEERRTRWLDSIDDLRKKELDAQKSASSQQSTSSWTTAKPTPSQGPARPAMIGTQRSPQPQKATDAPGSSQAGSATSAPAPRKSIFRAKPDPEQVKEQIDEAVKTVMSDVSGDGLSSLASELNVTAEDLVAVLQDPDFERMVAEEATKLAAG
jgi:hypothetical protein